jgi:lysophospholipase L1-like esterase
MLLAAFVVADFGFAHDENLPVNDILGVPGFPSCLREHPDVAMSVEDAAKDLKCEQNGKEDDSIIKIGCIGDSITAGVHSSGGIHPYPQQLQILLDAKHGKGKYAVTNLGACGSTMLKISNSPYWERPQFKTLTAAKWDIVTIMLGTNDAKDPGDHGPNNWLHNCGGVDHTSLMNCSFADDYHDMIDIVSKLGTTAGEAPKVYTLIPPPLMQLDSIGANQTVINSVYPKLVPLIGEANKDVVVKSIDIFTGMGGESNWASDPAWPKSCNLTSTWMPCGWWCDKQSCDQCHPNDNGYSHLATVLQAGLGL